MSRAAYHRAYYRAHLESRREVARVMARRRRWVRGVAAVICEAVEEARNDKGPPSLYGGPLTGRGDGHTLQLTMERGERVVGEGTAVKSTHRVLPMSGQHALLPKTSR